MNEIKEQFRKNLIKSKKYISSRSNEPFFVNSFIGLLHKYIQDIKKENPNITVEQLKAVLDNQISEMSKAVYVGCIAPDMYIEYANCLYLIKHPERFNELLEKIENGNYKLSNSPYKYRRSFEENLIQYILGLQKDFPRLRDEYSACLLDDELLAIVNSPDLSNQEKNKKADLYIRRNILPIYQKKCSWVVRLHTVGIKAYLQEDATSQEDALRKNLVKYISTIITQLQEIGLLDKYNQNHTFQMKRMSLQSLSYSEKDIEMALNPNYLSNLPIDDLLVLSVFWLNRYSKELDTYSEALFAISQFDLLPRLLSSSKIGSISIPEKELAETLIKMHTLYYPCEAFFQKQQDDYYKSNDDRPLSQEEIDGNYVVFSYDPLIEKIKELYGDEYEFYFKQSMPRYSHNLEEDCRFYSKLLNPISSAKTTKDEFLYSLLLSLNINPNLLNGGIILDSAVSPESVLSKRFVGLALDCNLTTPMRQHIRLDFLEDFLRCYIGNTKIQIYEGNDDFQEYSGKVLSNSICLPFTPNITKAIKEAVKKYKKLSADFFPQSQKYLSHLNFLRDTKKIPEHLKTETFNSKGKREKVFQKRYFDIASGKIYIIENDQFVEIPQGSDSPIQTTKGDSRNNDDGQR